jgi:mRNA interferase HicA
VYERIKFLKYLRNNNCYLLREGGRHSWYQNKSNNQRSAVPRHPDINEMLTKKICKDLGIPPINS